jgi:hypothetical protein
MMWVEKSTVLPSARHWRINWMIARAAMTSRPEVASSKMMTSGSWMIVRAIETFCLHAGRELADAAVGEGVDAERGEQGVAAAAIVGLGDAGEVGVVAQGLLGGEALVELGGAGEEAELAAGGEGSARASTPAISMRPASGRRRVAIIRRVVVLPAPLGPSSAKMRPGAQVRSRSSTACRTSLLRSMVRRCWRDRANRLASLWTAITGATIAEIARRPTAPDISSVGDALEGLVHQFADPWAFLRELIQNAIDAGSEQIEVRIDHDADRGMMVIEVADAGEGMTREIIDTG